MSRRTGHRVGAFAVGLLLGAISIWAAASLVLGARDKAVRVAPHQADEPLVGQEFAESLGLRVVDSPGACTAVAEAPPDQTTYCLDSVVSTEREAYLIGKRVNGHMPTALEEELFDLNAELAAVPDTPEGEVRTSELLDQIVAVMNQLEDQRRDGWR